MKSLTNSMEFDDFTGSETELLRDWLRVGPPADRDGRLVTDAYQPISLGVNGQDRLWVAVRFAEEYDGMLELPKPLLFWDAGDWTVAEGSPPAIIGDDGTPYAVSGTTTSHERAAIRCRELRVWKHGFVR